jgi:DNA-binding SARP family transcriptional activator
MRGFELTSDGCRVVLPSSTQRLVAYLALHDRPVPRSHIGRTLFGDCSEERVSGNVRTILWRLRRTRCELVEVLADSLAVSDQVVVDVHLLAATARRLARTRDPVNGADLDELASGGELLPGWHEDWVVAERERTRQTWLQALETAAERLTSAGCHADAVVAAMAAVKSEPLRETAHRALIAAHMAAGNRGEAVRQYQRYAKIIRRELGLEPAPELAAALGAAAPATAAPGVPLGFNGSSRREAR